MEIVKISREFDRLSLNYNYQYCPDEVMKLLFEYSKEEKIDLRGLFTLRLKHCNICFCICCNKIIKDSSMKNHIFAKTHCKKLKSNIDYECKDEIIKKTIYNLVQNKNNRKKCLTYGEQYILDNGEYIVEKYKL